MYVCLCNGHREDEIVGLAQSGVRCARAAYERLGGLPRCGQCLAFAQMLIDDIHSDSPADAMTAAPSQLGT